MNFIRFFLITSVIFSINVQATGLRDKITQLRRTCIDQAEFLRASSTTEMEDLTEHIDNITKAMAKVVFVNDFVNCMNRHNDRDEKEQIETCMAQYSNSGNNDVLSEIHLIVEAGPERWKQADVTNHK